jgi:hypothetical protein
MRAQCSLAAVTFAALCALSFAVAAGRPPAPRPLRLDPRDPEPLVAQDYLDLTLALHHGALQVVGVRRGSLPRPQPILRFRGQYQVRLYAGQQLLDLVRFSFPLTGAAGERTVPNMQLDRSLARGVSARTEVRVPFTPQVTRITVLDTRTGSLAPVDLTAWSAPPLRLPADGPKRTSVFAKPAPPATPAP